jgi:hypothetical protein
MLRKKGKIFLLQWLKKTQACGAGLLKEKIFPLVNLLLTGCSPVEPVSSSIDGSKINILKNKKKILKNVWINHRIYKVLKKEPAFLPTHGCKFQLLC